MNHQSPIIHQSSAIEKNCPYPGLRAFEEVESLYFKGREGPIDEVMEKLAANKFLLLTGASGDGKSSLIFAGLVPNCRAGFFKAKFNNWAIVSFRPERTPLKNLAEAIFPYFGYENAASVENSLKYGYAALIDLYKESSLFIDTNGDEWSNTGEEERKIKKRNASNLLIIVDQFEEFFTNHENFNRETSTATESTQVMGSLLLETARLAKEQDIPVYIVCTMRSDYLGQCAALSGFPEKIEECLFYLPRLKRQDIVQVIEEPATLSGNSISERLIQRLLNDTHTGIDILPVLQHCLHRIWLAADKGNKQMDLIHYAMVGGMTGDQLPEEDRQRFEKWFDKLPGYKRALFANASLGNVLNIHANELYLTAGQTATASGGNREEIIKSDALFIIETTFKCLTKIDDNRAIRNLMTIEEITEMVGKDKYTIDQVAEVIKPFCMHGNTFIRPFIIDETSTVKHQPSTILDITHEALIRNWTRLFDWAWEEHENVQTYREFRAQLDKWLNNNRKKEHLMSIGSLNYFGTWFKDQKINPLIWLKRYMWEDEEDGGTDKPSISQRLNRSELDEKAEEHFANIREYLNLSRKNIARKTRLARITVASIIVLCVVLVVAFFWANTQKNKAIELQHTIQNINKSNEFASEAYMILKKNPTLSFRLGEEAYNIYPGKLAKEVLISAYAVLPPLYKILEGHNLALRDVAFSPDSKYIVTCASDHTTRLWNINGDCLQVYNHTHEVYKVIFSPNNNFVLTVARDGVARLWDLNGNLINEFKDQTSNINDVEFSPDGEYVLTALSDNTFKLCNLNGDILRSFRGHTSSIRSVKFSPDGKYIVTASGDNTARIWNIDGLCLQVLKGHTKNVSSAKYSTDGKYIITASSDGTARLWDNNGMFLKVLIGHTKGLSSASFAPDGKYIVTASDDFTARIWDMEGNCLHVLKGSSETIKVARFSPDGKYIVTLSKELLTDYNIRLWDLQGREVFILKGHTFVLQNAVFSPNGKFLVTVSSDNTARIWDMQFKENPVLKTFSGGIGFMDYSPNGKNILTHSNKGDVILWDIKGNLLKAMKGSDAPLHGNFAAFSSDGNYIIIPLGKVAQLRDSEGNMLKELRSEFGNINNVKFSPNTNYIITTSDNIAQMWDMNGNSKQIMKEHTTAIRSIDISFDGNYIVTASTDNTARLWDTNGNCLKVLKGHKAVLWFTQISPDGQFIVTTSNDNTARIWDRKGYEVAVLKGHKMGVFRADFSPDSKLIVTVSDDKTARVWDLLGNELLVLNHNEVVDDADFSPDGKYIVTACDDNTARLWNLKGKELQVFRVHTSAVWRVSFSPDGKFILTASLDGTACLLPISAEDVLNKINVERVRGDIWKLTEEDKKLYGIFE